MKNRSDAPLNDLAGASPSFYGDGKYEIVGVVNRVIFANEDNGYHVIEIFGGGEEITATGDLPYIREGERITALGKFVTHSSYGRQFEIESAERALPDNREDIMRWLMSGAVKGIGPVTAERIFDRFGDDTLNILEQDPMQLIDVRGISRAKAIVMAEELTKLFDLRRMLIFLSEYGLHPSESLKVLRLLGENTSQIVSANPYVLCCTAVGLDFGRVDAMAFEQGFEYDNDNRLCAGVEFVIRHNLNNGHTCLPEDKLLPAARDLLRCEPELAEKALRSCIENGSIIEVRFGERVFCFLHHVYADEKFISERAAILSRQSKRRREPTDSELAHIEKLNGITYEEYQKAAIKTAVSSGICIITGGPGTGKTTILKAVVQLLSDREVSISAAAPTGRAAKRMSELMGCDASTIHRLLECTRQNDDMPVFTRNEENPLDAEVLILDEASMCDVFIMAGLLRAMKPNSSLILVGDADQLPAVGPGNIIRDMIASNAVPCIRLTEIYRQAASSLIVVNAHRINAGEPPITDRRNSDFFFLPARTESECAKLVVSLCCERLPKSKGWSPFTDIQLLTPAKKGALGTFELNKKLQSVLNPRRGGEELEFGGFTYRVGDKIMQTHNDYDIMWTRDGQGGVGLYNGDCGVVTGVDKAARMLYADFDGRLVCIVDEQLINIDPAYAVTVHKSQGSEYEVVVIPVFPSYSDRLIYRNLLYTAVTRARSMLILVGSAATLQQMVGNEKKSQRYTGLKKFLLGMDSTEGAL